MRILILAILAPLALTACNSEKADHEAPATANAAAANMTGHDGMNMAAPAQSESARAYAAANDRMHAAMGNIDPDADIAFMQGMIAHHRAAVEMSEIVLKYGKDAETRALAKTIIAAQTGEIKQMEQWLAKRGIKPAAPAGHDGH